MRDANVGSTAGGSGGGSLEDVAALSSLGTAALVDVSSFIIAVSGAGTDLASSAPLASESSDCPDGSFGSPTEMPSFLSLISTSVTSGSCDGPEIRWLFSYWMNISNICLPASFEVDASKFFSLGKGRSERVQAFALMKASQSSYFSFFDMACFRWSFGGFLVLNE
jgi:hypothetical protein